MKKFTIQFIFIIIGITVALYLYKTNPSFSGLPFVPQQTAMQNLQINDATLKIEVADTQAKRSLGLGGKQSLASDEGMLFIFDKPGRPPFWMKGLIFPLDFVWIMENKVVDILQNIQPPAPGQTDESLSIYQSKEDMDRVLEVNSGTVQRLNIKVGDTIKIQ